MQRDSGPRSAGVDLGDRAAAVWLTLSSLRLLADDEVAAAITQAMGCLDEVAQLASMVGADEPVPCLADIGEIETMVEEIYQHLRGDAGQG